MNNLFSKINKEVLRYMYLRKFEKTFTRDSISAGKKIQIDVEMFKYGTDENLPGVDIFVFEKLKENIIRPTGWVKVYADEFCRQIMSFSYPPPKSMYLILHRIWNQLPSRFLQCCPKMGIPLYIMETFHEIGGRKEDLQNFYSKLTIINASFL